MNTADLLNMDLPEIMRLKRSELAKVVQTLNKTSQSRVKTLVSAGLETPALTRFLEAGGVQRTGDKNLNALRSQYITVSKFLRSKTSTVKGYKGNIKTIKKNIKYKGTDEQFESDYSRLLRIVAHLEELYPYEFSQTGASQVRISVSVELTAHRNETDDEIMNRVSLRLWKKATNIYVHPDEINEDDLYPLDDDDEYPNF